MPDTERKAEMRRIVGSDIRDFREASGLAQKDISALLGLEGRDAMSKIERGLNNLTIVDYIEIMHFFRDLDPGHPAVALARYFKQLQAKAHPHS